MTSGNLAGPERLSARNCASAGLVVLVFALSFLFGLPERLPDGTSNAGPNKDRVAIDSGGAAHDGAPDPSGDELSLGPPPAVYGARPLLRSFSIAPTVRNRSTATTTRPLELAPKTSPPVCS